MNPLPGGALPGGGPPAPTFPLVAVKDLIMAGLRIAGITDRPQRTPSPDQFAECLPILNRMSGIWSTNRMNVYTIDISAYPLVAGRKTYTIGGPGLGADFDAPRPLSIDRANIIVNTTSPVVRTPVAILNDQQWREINVQDIPNGIPSKLYNDGAFPLSTIYLWTQALTTYQLELYTWRALPRFASINDQVFLPDGYETAIVYNLAVYFATQFPTQQRMLRESYQIARESLAAIQHLNAPDTMMRCDPSVLGGSRRGGWSYLTGRSQNS